ncbi:hypothetical protein V8017_09180 [Stenotrophomonas rhizophila]
MTIERSKGLGTKVNVRGLPSEYTLVSINDRPPPRAVAGVTSSSTCSPRRSSSRSRCRSHRPPLTRKAALPAL